MSIIPNHLTPEQIKKLEKILGQDKLMSTEGLVAEEYMAAVQKLITLCGDDPTRDGLQETPFRVLKAMLEYTEGLREDPKAHLEKQFDVGEHHELVLVRDIEFHSMCEHHFAPFYGKAHVGYIPGQHITGLSKIARMVDGYAKRWQVQERLTTEVAQAMEDVLQPKGTFVVIEAKHMCMCGRGIKKQGSSTVTSSVRGVFANEPEARAEFLSLLKI